MEITVTGRKMTVSDALRSYVEEKIGSSVKVFDISPMSAEVVLRKEKNPSNPNPAIAEVTLYTKGHIIRTEEAEEDMYAAIDIAAAKVERQLRKYKTRVVDRRHHGKKLQEMIQENVVGSDAPPASVLPVLDEHVTTVGEDEARVVRIKEVDLIALNEEEALLQIDLLGHDFFMYSDATDGLVSVMYRRKDGSYGILKPSIETLDD
ncbi:MAG: ribosome-associated translation inhibitor RaiA [Coriobacteriia bacterium]|jgi:putative sigma-54 modulation protein|nr:ribosome-associated translation inhibitor RaiA [Coriobacteriia bacterium]